MVQLGVAPQYAIVLEVPNEDIEARVSFRLLNPYTGQLYHMLSDPPPIGEARKCISRSTPVPITTARTMHSQRRLD
jgi:hypothetical protein